MRDLLVLLVHFLTTLARLLGPSGTRAVIAETLLIKHQLVILNRSRRRAPNLPAADRIVMGLCTLFMNPSRIRKVAAALKPATLLAFHKALKERKCRRLFSPQGRGKPGPKGPSTDLLRRAGAGGASQEPASPRLCLSRYQTPLRAAVQSSDTRSGGSVASSQRWLG